MRKKVSGKRVLALTLALVLNFTTVFSMNDVTVYAQENTEVATESVEESEEVVEESVAETEESEEAAEEGVSEETESVEESEEVSEETEAEETTEEVENEIMLMEETETWTDATLMNFDFNKDTVLTSEGSYEETIENGGKVKIAIYKEDGTLKEMTTPTATGLTTNGWSVGDYFSISFPTTYFKDNVISFSMRSSGTGPKDFSATYSVDGGAEKKLVDKIEITSTSLKVVCDKVNLAGADNADEVEIKITCTSDLASKNDESKFAKTGTSNVDILKVSGLTNGKTIESSTEETTETTTEEPETTPSETELVDIATARAGEVGTTYKVSGVVTFIDGRNVYVEDDSKGIDLYFNASQSDLSVGDVITAEGSLKVFNGLYELSDVKSYEKTGTKELPATEVTLENLVADYGKDDAYQSRRVLIKNAKLGAVSTSGNTELTQGDTTANIYKIPSSTAYAEGDKVDVYVIVSAYKTLQLRVANADDVTVKVIDPITDDMLTEGVHTIDYILSDAFDGSGKDIEDTTKKATATVIGQITHIYGNADTMNTAAISDVIDGETVSTVVYFNKTAFTAEVGDVITVTGTVKDYGGVRQIQDLANADAVTVVSTDADEFEAEEVTIKELESDDYLADYVVLKDVTIGAYNASGSTTVTDADNNSIVIYKGHSFPDTVKEGDTIDLYAIASKYATTSKTTYQLRVGTADSYVFVKEAEVTEPEEEQTFVDPISDDMIPEGCTTIDKILDGTATADADGNYTVIGQIATKFGNYNTLNSSIIEDVIDGQLVALQVYNTLADYNIGDVVTVTAGRTEYGKIVQMQSLTTSKLISDKVDPIDARIVDMDDLNSDSYISQYVVVKNVTLGEYSSTASTTITDADGKTIPIYRAATYPDGVAAGDTADVYGVSSRYNDTFQMRVGYSTDYKVVGNVEVDSDYVLGIASIRGNYSEDLTTKYVYGDLYAENDQLDTNTKLTISTNDIPMISNTTNGVTTRNLGTKTLVKDAYYLIETSSLGYGAMNFDFQMRGSNKGVRDFKILYSTDGKTYAAAGNTNVQATNTIYSSDGTSTNESADIDGTNGEFSLVYAGKWHTVTVAIPDGAANAEKLYIKVLVSSATSVDGTTVNGGTNYFTTISLTGSPVIADNMCGFVKVSPEAGPIAVNSELTFTSSTKDAEIFYTINGGAKTKYDATNKPVLVEADFPATVTCYATKADLTDSVKLTYSFTKAQVATVKASPNGGAVKANTTVQLTCATEGAVIQYSLDNGTTWTIYEGGFKLTDLPVTVQAKATLEGYTESETVTLNFTKRSKDEYNVYFGQIHAHTNYSDGAGTADQAFAYASEQADQIDFLALTDHSNLFDNDTSANIKDGSMSTEWVEGHELADKYTKEEPVAAVDTDTTTDAGLTDVTTDDTVVLDTQSTDATDDYFVGIMGYEMTWSGGAPGHMNTFNTDGFMSRNMTGYGNGSKTSLTNYYGQLKTVPEAFSMFNHPGTTFGDFYDFGYYDDEIDNYISLIEVGNGEGAIGSSGYFPSYEYYTRALDKGWHVAPTNDQDNHKGKWGDANTGRTVILADTLTRDNIYDALRNMRVYATEDNDLNIQYTLNGMDMGYIYDNAPDSCDIVVKLDDPTDSAIGKVEVIVNGGLSVASETVSDSSATLEFNLPADYSYYYIRVTQADGDKAVTAPVWVSSVEALGISSLSTDASLEVAGEPINVNLDLYNNENDDFNLDSIVYTVDGEIVHKTDLTAAELTKVAAKGEASDSFVFTNDKVGSVSIEATVIGTLNGVTKTYTQTLALTYIDSSMVTRVIVDGTHNNDYVTGYYGGNVGNFADIAASDYVQVNVVTDEITEDMLNDCSLLVLSAPAKKSGTYDGKTYAVSHFEDSFVELVKNYVKGGGNVIFCGLADYQDSTDCQSTTEINKLLEAIGATTRLNSDEIVDDDNNGGQIYRLYFDDFNMNSAYLSGVTSDQTYSAYSGASVLVNADAVAAGTAEALVYGHDTTYSIDSKDVDSNYVAVEKGNIVALAHETLSSGSQIFVGGTVFVSDFEVKSDLDNASDTYYANRNILLNILGDVKQETPISTIAQMRAGEEGEIFAIEGYVTAGNSNSDTTFFDTIYVQDDTAGTTVFPFSDSNGTVSIGTKVQLVGYVDGYQGDKEIQIISSKVLDAEPHVYAPKKVTAAEAMDYDANGGSLLQVEGQVTKVVTNSSGVDYFYVKDASGAEARVFIDGYILASDGVDTVNEDVQVGNYISAVGLCYINPDGVCLRVRDRDEVVLTDGTATDEPNTGDASTGTTDSSNDDDDDDDSNSSTTPSRPSQGAGIIHIAPGLVPLAGMLPNLDAISFILSEQSAHIIGSELFQHCVANMPILLHLGNGIGYVISSDKVGLNDAEFDLAAKMTPLVGFASQFTAIQFSPANTTKLPYEIGIQMNLGVQYAGKAAYIYHTNMTTNTYEFDSIQTVNEIGNIGFNTDELSNAIIMIEQ